MSNYLKLIYLEDDSQQTQIVNDYEFRNKPFANSDVILAPIENFKLLTKGEDVKRVYDLKLCIKENYDFLPGDTIGILPQNNVVEINKLLIRLNIEHLAEKIYKLEILKDTVKKNPTIPKHIPHSGTLRDIFTYYIDIRKPPKKLFLKALIQFTRDPKEIEKLEEVSSPRGTKQYSELICGSAQTFLGLLETFTTCYPPMEVILEHSLPLQPRYFSIASSPLVNNALHITFFIVENRDGTRGVCTGWLEDLIKKNQSECKKIPIYFRKANNFRIPTDFSVPVIMIATGTGLAPFKGFLDHRLLSKINEKKSIGEALLFYGCRYSNRDFLYSREIQEYLNEGVLTKLYTAFSRDTDKKCYVQDRINESAEVVDYLLRKNAIVYVCGDMKTMVKDVKQAVGDNLVKYGAFDKMAAEGYLNDLVQQNRLIVDSWA